MTPPLLAPFPHLPPPQAPRGADFIGLRPLTTHGLLSPNCPREKQVCGGCGRMNLTRDSRARVGDAEERGKKSLPLH